MKADKKKTALILQEIGIGILKETLAGPVVEVSARIADQLKMHELQGRVEVLESRLKHQIESRQRLIKKISNGSLSGQELQLAITALIDASERTYFFEGLFENGVLEDIKNTPDVVGRILHPSELANSTNGLIFILGAEDPFFIEMDPERFRRFLLERPQKSGLTPIGTEHMAVAASQDFIRRVNSQQSSGSATDQSTGLATELSTGNSLIINEFSATCRLLKPYDSSVAGDFWSAKLRFRKAKMSSVSIVGFEYGHTEIELVWVPFGGPGFVQYPLAKLTNRDIRKSLNWGGVQGMGINLGGVVLLKREDIRWVLVDGKKRLHLKPYGDNNYWVEFEFWPSVALNEVEAQIKRLYG